MSSRTWARWLIVTLGIVLSLACVAAGQDLGAVIPGVKDAPPPDWARPGCRLIYYSAVASTPASPYFYTPNENGDWVSGDGKRWDQWTQPGAAGHGFTAVDLLEVGRGGILASVQAWQKDMLSGQVTPIADGRSAYACPVGGGDYWLPVDSLARIPQVLRIDPDSLDETKILRMNMKMLDGKVRKVLRLDFTYAKARHVVAYELDTGIMVYKAVAAQGGQSRFTKGNTIIMQMWLYDRRQLQLPWANAPLHEALVKGKKLRYEGTTSVAAIHAGHVLTLPVAADMEVTANGRTWLVYSQTTTVTRPEGMPPALPQVSIMSSGTAQADSPWIPPATLKSLRSGQILDSDKFTKETVRVKSVGDRAVVISCVGEAVTIERTYDMTSGLMVGLAATGGPGQAVAGAMRFRLTRGAVGAPAAQPPAPAEQTGFGLGMQGALPFAPRLPASDQPARAAADFLKAYKSRDLKELARHVTDENQKMLAELAGKGPDDPKYRELFLDGWQPAALNAWDSRPLAVRYPAPGRAWISIGLDKDGQVMAMVLQLQAGTWKFSDVHRLDKADFTKATAEPQ